MAIESVIELEIKAENTFSDWMQVDKRQKFGFDVYGTFAGTVTVQKSYDGGTTILDDDNFTAPTGRISVEMAEAVQVRAGIKTGNYTSGTASIRLGRG